MGVENWGRLLNQAFLSQGVMVGSVEDWVFGGAKAKAVVLVLRLKAALGQRFLV